MPKVHEECKIESLLGHERGKTVSPSHIGQGLGCISGGFMACDRHASRRVMGQTVQYKKAIVSQGTPGLLLTQRFIGEL